jgi:sterol desaturase/sphingolipid hydroxylase (fatty acid hydroxylase superfamily)
VKLPRVPANVIYFAVYASGLYSFLFWPPVMRLAQVLTGPIRSALPLEKFASLPFSARWVIVFGAVDLAAYWAHRIAHANRFLWHFHRVHHSDTSLGPLTAFRCHVVEVAWRMFARALPLSLLAVDPSSMPIGLFVIPLFAEVVAHSDLDWNFGPIVGPAFHRIHHGPESRKNLSMLLTIWDTLFGTDAAPKKETLRLVGAFGSVAKIN